MGTLSREQARRAYDRIGSLQDSQAFYEDRATAVLLQRADFGSAQAVFEFGCGTGRFARRLLEEHLPATAHYRGIDLSPRMVGLAQARLEPYAERARVSLSEGGAPTNEKPSAYDRFVSNYVLDLLPEEEIREVLQEAQRILAPGGLLCLTSLSTGVGPLSRGVANAWGRIQGLAPGLVGGCRPLELLGFLPETHWKLRHHEKVVAFAIPSEVVVAERR